MNDDMMFDYLVQMGAMRPEEAEIKRKQAMVDALRKQGSSTPEGQMIGKHYVAPSFTQYAAQLGQGYMAGQSQKGVDQQAQGMNDRQRLALEEMRKRRGGGMQPAVNPDPDPYANARDSSGWT